jgi:CheY-like chemotaxis protein
VLLNLVGNGIKFTEEGHVSVGVGLAARSEGRVKLEFVVQDSGIGIDPEKVASIFDPFEQADTSTSRRYGGTGLGLTICERLVRMMNGRIWVDSTSGVGSCFRFTCEMDLAPGEHVPPEPVLLGRSILVVDGRALSRHVLTEMLTHAGAKVQRVSDGAEALARLRWAARENAPFDAALIDVSCPSLDAFGVVEALADEPSIPTSVVAMLPSAARNEQAARCARMGLPCLVKPLIEAGAMREIAAAIAGESPSDQEGSGDSPGDDRRGGRGARDPEEVELPEGLRVLLAEDNRINQVLAIRLLRDKGCDVTLAGNGAEAVDRFESGTFDLVLMDVQMPEMSGLEATAAIRRADGGRDVPIVAMTAHAMTGDRERCLAAGMDDYVSKPVSSGTLFEVMLRALEARGGRQEPSPGRGA